MKENICQFCGREAKNLHCNKVHEVRCKNNPNRKVWNVDYSKRKTSNGMIKAREEGRTPAKHLQPSFKGKNHSAATKKKLSEIAKQRQLGGHTSKQRILFEKKDGSTVYLQSSYEITFAESLERDNVNWIRPTPLKWIDADGQDHRYYPDFYLTDYDLYVDTKNDFLIKKDADKIERVKTQNKVNIFIADKNHLHWNFVLLKL